MHRDGVVGVTLEVGHPRVGVSEAVDGRVGAGVVVVGQTVSVDVMRVSRCGGAEAATARTRGGNRQGDCGGGTMARAGQEAHPRARRGR